MNNKFSCKICANCRYIKSEVKCIDNTHNHLFSPDENTVNNCPAYKKRNNIFQAKTDDDMLRIYNDIIESAKEGNVSDFIKAAGRDIRNEMLQNVSPFSVALDLAEKQFYKEICYRFFERDMT